MPELPEVETVRRGLAPTLVGARILHVDLHRKDLRFPFPKGFAARLQGRQIMALRRRAKFLIADLDDGGALIAHLGMSGSFRLEGRPDEHGAFVYPRSKNPAHDHVVIHMDRGILVYNDPRRFGFLDLTTANDPDPPPFLAKLGVEPLSNDFGADALAMLLAGRKTSIKAALLDQTLIAGLGNIYVCEALHRAGIAPERPASEFAGRAGAPTKETMRLAGSIRDVLEEAILAGGSSLRDHRQADGSLGYFQHNFRVYDRVGESCPRAECKGIIGKKTQNGRTTFFCPKCQK